jgi:hypothetical protein
VSPVDWSPRIYVSVGWFLLDFVLVGIGISSWLVPTNIYNSSLVLTMNYKEKLWFSPEWISM